MFKRMIIAALIMCLFIIQMADRCEAWLGNSMYRRAITLAGSTGGAATDYVMLIVVHYGAGADGGDDIYLDSKCQTDFDDVRFTASDGSTVLNYYREQKIDSDKASFWVEVDAIPADPDTTDIYIYYGDGMATTTSDPDATFIEYEDFSVTPTMFDNGSLTVNSVAGGVEGNCGQSTGGDSHKVAYQNDTSYAWADHYCEGWLKYEGAQFLHGGLFICGQDSGVNGYDVILDARGTVSPQIRKDGDYGSRTDGTAQPAVSTWYFFQGWRTGTTVEGRYYADTYGSAFVGTVSRNDVAYTTGYSGIYAYDGTDCFYDSVRVRKLVFPGPTFSSFGIEESKPVSSGAVLRNATLIGTELV